MEPSCARRARAHQVGLVLGFCGEMELRHLAQPPLDLGAPSRALYFAQLLCVRREREGGLLALVVDDGRTLRLPASDPRPLLGDEALCCLVVLGGERLLLAGLGVGGLACELRLLLAHCLELRPSSELGGSHRASHLRIS